jgi:hypothetical protein
MSDKLDHLQTDNPETKDATDLADAYRQGFFDNPTNVTEVANYLSTNKETYEQELDEFFASSPDSYF